MANTLQADLKGRVNLGLGCASQLFLIEELDEGELLLKKASVIPDRELWLHQDSEQKERVLKGFKQAKQGRLIKDPVEL